MCFVRFTPVNSTRFIEPVIADAIGFAFDNDSRADPKSQLFGYLEEKQVLLLLDNLEQLLEESGIEVLAFLGTAMILTGNYARALELLNGRLEKAMAADDCWFAAMCLSEDANATILIGQYENVHERMKSAVADWRLMGDHCSTIFGLNILS